MPDPADSPDFSSVMAELGMLPIESAEDLLRESSERQVSPTRLALEKGLISADQAEIAEALLAPFDAIPGYELLSIIGQGGMGAVFRARQISLNRIVALKTVLLNRISGASSLARFEQEAVTLARLVHPHIVSAYDFGKRGAKLFLALEYVQGEDADKFVRRRGSLEETFSWQLIRQAAAGLAHAAQLGIVHRDIKPANLLLVNPPAGFPLPPGIPLVKITDFGLALLNAEDDDATRLTSANTALGSPNYMAPEQVSSDAVDLRADIYALGATAYHFLAGEPPFSGMKLQAILSQKLSAAPKPLAQLRPDLSPPSIELVERMMARDPAERPQDYDEIFAALEPWSHTTPVRRFVSLAEEQRLATEPTRDMPSPVPTQGPVETLIDDRLTNEASATTTNGLTRRNLLFGSLTLVGGLVGFAAWQQLGRRPSEPNFQYQPRHYYPEYSLFMGESVAGFSDLRGEWRPAKDHEGGIVLAGSNGSITRILPADAFVGDQSALWQYRVTLILNRHEARAAHLLFAFAEGPTTAVKFHRVTVLPTAVEVAPADGWAFGRTEPAPLDPDRDEMVLQVVRHPQGWLVLVNERPAFHLPPVAGEATDRFSLAVDGGTAWFSDISLAPWQEKL